MRRTRLPLLSLATLLAACAVAPTALTPAGRPGGAAAPGRAAASAPPRDRSPAPGPLPSGATTPPAASAAPPTAPSAAATFKLSGRVRIDPTYLVRLGLVSAPSGGGLISDHGAAVTRSGAILIERAGGGLVSNNGGALISDHGSGLVANNGGSVVANNGGGLTSKTKYALGQAPAGQDLQPIARMVVQAVSLRTGLPIGEPALTAEDGSFTLALPPLEGETVRIVARVPQTGPDDPLVGDPKLAYDALVRPSEARLEIDEDTRVISRHVRSTVTEKLAFMIDPAHVDNLSHFDDPAFTEEMRSFVFGLRADFIPAVKAAAIPPEAILPLAARSGDAVLALIDLQAVEVDPVNTVWKDAPPGTLALASLGDALRRLRDLAAVRLAADPGYFEKQAWFQAENSGRAVAWRIERPTDFVDYFVDTYVTPDGMAYDRAPTALEGMGLPPEEAAAVLLHIKASGKSIFSALAIALAVRPEAKAEVHRLISEAAAARP